VTNDGERRLREARALNNGAGDALSVAVELAVTPGLFAFAGWRLDEWLGTFPVFLITFFFVVAVYEIWKLFTRYDARMKAEEQKLFKRGEGLP
jgi:F0F1-type ATP synthase assembly protein I